MRLYRGLKEIYESERRPGGLVRTDFTDCPYIAMLYASGGRGQVLVVDVPEDKAEVRVSRELWFNAIAERFMIWGKFDDWIIGIIPAKELRQIVRGKGMRSMPDTYKSDVLKGAIDNGVRKSFIPITTLEECPQEFTRVRGTTQHQRNPALCQKDTRHRP